MRAFQSGEADRRPGNLDFVEGLNDPLRIAKYRDLAYGGSNRPALGVDAQPTAKHAETPGKQGGHIVIGQNEGGNPSAISDQPSATGFEEWGYAERAWYLEDRRGLSGILRALLWPTEGIVEVGRYDRVWAQRTPQPPSELFVFRVSDGGVLAIAPSLADDDHKPRACREERPGGVLSWSGGPLGLLSNRAWRECLR